MGDYLPAARVPSGEVRLPRLFRPYGATTLAGIDGRRQPSANELGIARYQGQHVADIARRLFRP